MTKVREQKTKSRPIKNKSKSKDVLAMIRDQHRELQRLGAVVLDPHADNHDKQSHLARFADLLRQHSEGEERSLYEALEVIPSDEAFVLESREEHRLAEQCIEEIDEWDFQDRWTKEVNAKAHVLIYLILNHAKREERHLFALARRHLAARELVALGTEFLAICQGVAEQEALLRRRPSRVDLLQFSAHSRYL
jgi:hemerythrin-like domain-containing protein